MKIGWEEDFLAEMSHWLILLQLQTTLLLATEVIKPDGPVGMVFLAVTLGLFLTVFVIVISTMKKLFFRASEVLLGKLKDAKGSGTN